MYSSIVYSYIPRQLVVLYSGSSTRRYEIVYAKPLTLNKGVNNQLQFQFLNQEQKPVDVTGMTLTFRLISYDGSKVYFRKALTSLLPLKGITQLNVSPAELTFIDPQKCSYSLEISDENLPVFVNADAGARGQIDIVDSILPRYIPTREVTVPDHGIPNISSPVTFYSSVILGNDIPDTTVQIGLAEYTGNIALQGSTIGTAEWYYITEAQELANTSDTQGYMIEGYHPYLRVEFQDSTGGNVTSVLVRS